jgi:SAM-dependent methyltransferase
MSDNFYRAFEERYRGARELIAERLTVYDHFTLPLAAAYPGAVALDLGCGRGEWLELAASQGFAAFGVDLDEGMLAACRERGLNVDVADALTTLRARADASVAMISAFHLVEHLPFDLVKELALEAERVLVPGGLLIMETPNAENLLVGTNNFYLDPSHIKPIPALLLGFLADYSGFARHAVVRLHGEPVPPVGTAVGLLAVLYGVSLDYAVVAQKQADAAILSSFDSAFDTEYGVSVENMAAHFDQSLLGALARAEARASQSDGLDLQAQEHGRALAGLDQAIRHVSSEFDKRLTQLEAEVPSPRIDAMGAVLQLVQEQLQRDMAWQVTVIEKRVDAAFDEIDARSRRRASEADERRLQHERLLEQRIDVIERQMEQVERRVGPLTRRQSKDEPELRNSGRRVADRQRHADNVSRRFSTTEEELRQQRLRADQAEAQLHALHQQMVAVVESTSWRVTLPLRLASSYSRRSLSAARDGRILSALVRRIVLPLLRLFPKLEGLARRRTESELLPSPPAIPESPDGILLPHDFANLPESSREVLLDLARAGMAPPHQR